MKVKGVLRKEVKEWLFYHLFKGDVVWDAELYGFIFEMLYEQ